MKKMQKILTEFPVSTEEVWREAVDKLLKGAPFDKVMRSETPEGIRLEPIFRKEVLDSLPAVSTQPGFDGYLRGTRASGYRSGAWEISQELPFGTPKEFNKAAREDLMAGQDALNIVLDIATLKGLDPESARVGEVAACGLSLACLQDIQTAFKGILPEAVSFHFRTGCNGLAIGSLFFTWLDYEGADFSKIKGSLGMDPYAVQAAAGTLPTSLEQLFIEQAVMAHCCAGFAPGIKSVGVSTLPYHQAGASAVEELGIAMATGSAYLKELTECGLSIDVAASQIRFSFCVGPNFFMEIAKLRAARVLWAQVVAAFGGNAASQKIEMHARTGFYNKTRKDPYVNILRTTTEALSAVIGSVDSLCVGCFDEVSRITDNFSRRISRNTHVILQEECELTGVVDPAGGSWAVEWLTDQVCSKAWTFFQEIEGQGGFGTALENEFIFARIAKTAKGNEDKLNKRRTSLVGTNVYPNLAEKSLEGEIPDCGDLRRIRIRELSAVREGIESDALKKAREALSKIPDADRKKVLSTMVEAFGFGATIEEVTNALRAEPKPVETIRAMPSERLATKYEYLRDAARVFEQETGEAPKIFLCNLGSLHRHKARADFTKGFFQTGGFKVISPSGFDDPLVAADAFVKSGAGIVVVCGKDEDYVAEFRTYANAIRGVSREAYVVLAGFPGENEDSFRKGGMDDYIFIKSNNYEVNHRYLMALGVL